MTATAVEETTATNAPEPHDDAGRPDPRAARARAATLFAEHGRLVQGLCRALLRDTAEAEDAAQQVFLSAYRALLGGASVREPAAWLATIARNECSARARRRMREPLALETDDAPSDSDPVAEAIRRADLRALWLAISALPAQQRDALLMREFAGLSYAELAQALAVSEPAVEALLSRARTRLRGQLSTVFASLGGASSVPAAVARLFGGVGSAGGAAKLTAAAVTVAAVAGGADVGPRVVDRGPLPAPPHAKHATRAVRPTAAAVAPVVPATVARAAPAASVRRQPPSVVPRERSERDARIESEPARTRGGGDEPSTGEISHQSEAESMPVVTIATTVPATTADGPDAHSGSESDDASGDKS